MDMRQYIREEYAKGTPVKDIAQTLGISRKAVKSRAGRDKDCPPHGGFSVGNGTMGVERSLKGEEVMNEPTKADVSRLQAICEERGLPFEKWGIWWDKTRESSIAFYNKEAQEADQKAREEFLERIAKTAPKTKKQPLPTKNLAVFASFDVHIGKHCELIRTGNEYTPDKAVRQVLEGQATLYQMVKPHGVSDILFPMGNDIVHVDNNRNSTTSGTPQDNYGSVESQKLMAAELYIKAIEQWAKTHNVWLAHVHSNHDRTAGWDVSVHVATYFRAHPRVHVTGMRDPNVDQRHRKYFVFAENLIMFQHGESKEEKIVGTIKKEAREALAATNRTYCYQGHIHSKATAKRGTDSESTEKDENSMTVIRSGSGAVNQVHVETVRSPSPADGWHSEKNFLNFPAIEVFLHNERHQFGRFTHEF